MQGIRACAIAALLALLIGPAHADDDWRITALLENDSLYFDSDEYYTNGLRFSYLGPGVARGSAWEKPFDLLSRFLPVFSSQADERSRRYAVSLGQSIFTPEETDRVPPDPNDRPYAGWLYLGASLLQDTNRRTLDHLELQLGVVGPAAGGEFVQNEWHQIIGVSKAKGWDDQLHNEPGIVLSYERKWRVPLLRHGRNGLDVIPELGGTVGNIFTYGQAGALLRLGNNLEADYGPVRIRPALSGTDYFNAAYLDSEWGVYGFLGAQGRVVARDIFLDGNSFRSSPDVEKEIFVADLQAGVSLFWSSKLRLDFSAVYRTEEFENQDGGHLIGTAAASFSW